MPANFSGQPGSIWRKSRGCPVKLLDFNDRMRFEFAGRPERCVVCGSFLKHTVSHPVSTVTIKGQTVRVAREKHQYICPHYGNPAPLSRFSSLALPMLNFDTPPLHECYIFFADDPGLAPFLSYSVGAGSPTARAVLYTTVAFGLLFVGMFVIAKVLGG